MSVLTTAQAPEQLLTDMRRLVAGQNNARLFFFWDGDAAGLHRLLTIDSAVAGTVEWLDVNNLAEDVIPRRAREVLRAGLRRRIGDAVAADRRILVVEQPYLLLRYEPSAPLALFWDLFVDSRRAVIVLLPPPQPRPAALPRYVQFQDDPARRLVGTGGSGAVLVSASRGDLS